MHVRLLLALLLCVGCSRPPHEPADVEVKPEPQLNREPAKGPVLPEWANPYKLGTQTKLRELRQVPLPQGDRLQLSYSGRHELLFARARNEIWVYDLKIEKLVGTRAPKEQFTDMSLTPDESALFVADFGGDPKNRSTWKLSHVHRFDLAKRVWESRFVVETSAWKLAAVDPQRVLLLEENQWVDLTLHAWEQGDRLRELSRTHTGYEGGMVYYPRTGRIYHCDSGGSLSLQANLCGLSGNDLKFNGFTRAFGSAKEEAFRGSSVVLSPDGSRLYYGVLGVETADIERNVRFGVAPEDVIVGPRPRLRTVEFFPEIIVAASRDLAFGSKGYYDATHRSTLGRFPFKITAEWVKGGFVRDNIERERGVITVTPDGLSVWVIDRDENVARQYAIEGERAGEK